MRYLFIVVIALAFAPSADAQAKRRVYVLHSGMHIILAPADKDHAARTLKELLQKRGIAARDLFALDSPFPTATLKEMVPRAGLLIYLEATDPASRSSQEAYVRLHKALQAQGVTSNDDIIWIGHSAGGQIGMTMAHLAHNLGKFPDLAKKTQSYRFAMVITLGSAVGSNPVPADVELRHYYSAGDTMLFFLSKHGDILSNSMKQKVVFKVCYDLRANARVRVYPNIEHASWYEDEAVLDRILREGVANEISAWRKAHADTNRGIGLGQLFAHALEADLRISLEEIEP